MPPVKSLDRISARWISAAQAASGAYEDGIENPKKDWATETKKAEDAYIAGVQAAAAQKRFGKGVAAAGTQKWKSNALSKGVARWAPGISLGRDAYEKGFAPYRAVIERTTLPPRGPRGAPGNIQRVTVMSKALHDERIKRGGA